jgi:subtilisin family serine protease
LFILTAVLVPDSASAQDPSEGTLSAVERSKLDGRFERIVRQARGGTLEVEIESMQKLARRRASDRQRSARERQKAVDGQAGRGLLDRLRRPEDRSTSRAAVGVPSVMDVRPDSRSAGGRPVYEAVVRTASPSTLETAGVTVVASVSNFATVRATPEGLRRLAQTRAVSKVRSPKTLEAHNDIGAAEVGARTLNSGAVGGTAYRGEETLSCIIDSGIDWSHPDFTDEEGDTRIQAIWDQVDDSTSVSTPAENDPSRFREGFNPDYGSEYRRSDIQAALDGSGSVNQKDLDGHGTHVAGTAASSGEAYRRSSGTRRYRGAAPASDIIAVKAGNGSYSFTNVINGVVYCQDVARESGKPVVINMSLGTDFAPHDGSSFAPRAIEQLSRPGSVVVTSAGNSGSPFSPIHTQTSLAADDSVDVGVGVTQYAPNDGGLNDLFTTTLWTYEPGPYEVSVYTPNQQDTLTVRVDDPDAIRDTTLFTPRGGIFLESATDGNGRYFQVQSFDVLETAPPAEGKWTVRIRHEGDSPTPVHGWFLTSQLGSGEDAGQAAFQEADNQFTIGAPATSKGAIAVGNYVQRTRWSQAPQGPSIGVPLLPKGIISSSSSRGPTVDGRTKPDVAAPGTWTASALSDDASPTLGRIGVVGDGEHEMLTGTSMSAPLTAGSVALLLQENPSLSTAEVRSLLRNTARADDAARSGGGVPNQTFGAGKLNVLRALTSLTGQGAPVEILAYNQPADFDQDTSVPLGEGGAERAALRFTPAQSGRVAGAYLSLGANQEADPANELSDSLRVEVWTDDGGAPGRQIGRTVQVAPSALRGFSPNHVSLSRTGAAVQAGEDYHVVIDPKDGAGPVDLLAETVSPTSGRSATFENGSWSSIDSDLVVRVQVRTDVTAPAAVAGLSVETAAPQNVSLRWEEVSSVDLGGYLVYRNTRPVGPSPDLAPFDTTEAGVSTYTDTTATEGQTYYYRVASVDRAGNASEAMASASAFLYPDDVQAEVSRSFGEGGASSGDYRLVALPGTVDRDVGEILAGEAGVDWSVLWDDGSESNFLVEYDGSETFNFRPGRGFWVVSKQGLSVSESFPTVSLQADTAATIPLHDGWNIISNPFGKAVSWQAVRAANEGQLQPLFGFSGAFAEADTLASAETGRAFYFLNNQGLSELTIPYPGAPRQGPSAPAAVAFEEARAQGPASSVAVTASVAGGEDGSSTVRIRSRTGSARTGAPIQKVVAPPRRLETVSLRIRDESAESPRRTFLASTRRDFDEGQTVPVVLRADTSAVRLRATTKGIGRTSVALIDRADGESYDLSGRQPAAVTVEEKSASFVLAVGTDAFVNEQVESATPESVGLTTAPNPFREQTTIRYRLPSESSVQLKVYDTLGRQVATLLDTRKKAGTHRVQFSARDLASGVYFGRLTVDGTVVTRKLTVVR